MYIESYAIFVEQTMNQFNITLGTFQIFNVVVSFSQAGLKFYTPKNQLHSQSDRGDYLS